MLSVILAGVLGYLVGSIPTAFLIVRWKSKVDVRVAGSGNVGALNSYVVTRSKAVGLMVLCMDLLKGVAAVLLAGLLIGGGFASVATAGAAAVVGHNFPVWLRFRGGRGLAVSAGVMVVLQWLYVGIWCLLWLPGYLITRDINVGSVIACVVMLVGTLVSPAEVLQLMLPDGATVGDLRVLVVFVFCVMLVKHIQPVSEYIRLRRSTEGSGSE